MPQLNPAPWFIIMLAAWLVVLITFKAKTLASTTTTPPQPASATKHPTTPWSWPWT